MLFQRIEWMDLANRLRMGPAPIQHFLSTIRQSQRALGHIQEHVAVVEDHLGRRLPLPIQFCSTWEVRYCDLLTSTKIINALYRLVIILSGRIVKIALESDISSGANIVCHVMKIPRSSTQRVFQAW